MGLYSMLCASLDGKGACGKMNTWICMIEFLHHSSETTTTLLTEYTPIPNKTFKVWKQKHYVVHLKLIHYYMSIMSQMKNKRVIEEFKFKKNKIKMWIVKIYLGISLELLQTVWVSSVSVNSLVHLLLLKIYRPLPM